MKKKLFTKGKNNSKESFKVMIDEKNIPCLVPNCEATTNEVQPERPFNAETTLAYKWFINTIDELLYDNPDKELMELVCLLSETIEGKIKEELSECNEGYVSELIGNSFDKIDYEAIIIKYKKYNS